MKYYIIGMSNNEISQKYMSYTIPEIERVFGVTPEFWEAVTPETLHLYKDSPLQFSHITGTKGKPYLREFTPTEKAVWLTHYNMWEHVCELDEPAWVFEHDCDYSRVKEKPEVPEGIEYISCPHTGCMWCVYITPLAAGYLTQFFEGVPVTLNPDGFMDWRMRMDPWFSTKSMVLRNGADECLMYGTTISHDGKKIGDYDDRSINRSKIDNTSLR